MNRFVLDASVSVAWIVPDDATDYAISVRQLLAKDGRAVVPPLWSIETANALGKAVRRKVLTPEDAEYGMRQLEILTLSGPRIEIDSGVFSVWQAFDVARKHQISAYDGCYLELAIRERLPLATLDKALRGAAQKADVELLL